MAMKYVAGTLASVIGIATLYGAVNQNDEKTSDSFPQAKLVIPEAKLPKGFPKPGKVGTVVVKEYPAYRAARVTEESMGENKMFGELFRHIKKNNIAMTAPVEMTYTKTNQAKSMAFLYGKPEIGEAGTAGNVEVVDLPAKTVVSIGFRGRSDAKQLKKHEATLQQWLKENATDWKADGDTRLLGYNSPFVPAPMRYNEVQIPVKAANSPKSETQEVAKESR